MVEYRFRIIDKNPKIGGSTYTIVYEVDENMEEVLVLTSDTTLQKLEYICAGRIRDENQ